MRPQKNEILMSKRSTHPQQEEEEALFLRQRQRRRLKTREQSPVNDADTPGLVPDILGSTVANASSKLCRAWGQVRDHRSLVFFDPGARANFVTPQLAEKMGIKTNEMGPAYTASMAAPGHEVAVTPLIGKLRLHIKGYMGHEEFYIMPLEGCDVLLGMPWFYNHKEVLDSFNKKITLEIKGRKVVLDVKLKGKSTPLVSASAVPRLMKQHISAYLIYVKKRDKTESPNLSSLDVSRRAFLDEYADCFSKALPGQLPPERQEDHSIDLIPGSAAPNKPPYRVNSTQQEEIMTQVNELLQKGHNQPSSSPSADVPKTAFRTTFELYEFLVMPFGLTNASATFNRMIDRILRPLRHCVGTFFDDMIVFSKSAAKHMEHLRAVFEMLRKKGLVVNGKKSEFLM
ncbi:hypothetical protein L7F22_066347 [Adiantum nelumboides]|nr:hypothetical protein [Adiantum nelumboides]